MATLVKLYWILKVLSIAVSVLLGSRKVYRWLRKKLSKRKPTA